MPDARPGSTVLRCPVCGRGRLRDLAYDGGTPEHPPAQRAESHEVQVFTCGHEVTVDALDTADAEELDVERRTSDETVDPAPGGET